jgi:hypothetical protein
MKIFLFLVTCPPNRNDLCGRGVGAVMSGLVGEHSCATKAVRHEFALIESDSNVFCGTARWNRNFAEKSSHVSDLDLSGHPQDKPDLLKDS